MGFLEDILSSTGALHSRVAANSRPESQLFEPHELPFLPDRPNPGLAAAAMSCAPNVCAHCNHRLVLGVDGNALVCEHCGIEARTVACEDEETRTFADDDPETKSKKKRTEYDKRDSQHAMCTFDERAIADDSVRRVATNRLNQTLVWLQWLRGPGVPGELALTDDEADTFTAVARMACLQWAKESQGRTEDGEGTDAHFGSPVFWALALALGVVARRDCGFRVPDQEMVDRFTMTALHVRLGHYKSFAVVTAEKIGNRTQVSGAAYSRATDDKSKRSARFDSLGDSAARKRKLERLNGLIKRSRVWGEQGENPYVIGLAKPVLQDLPPTLLDLKRKALPPALRMVEPKVVGLEKDLPSSLRPLTGAAAPVPEAESDSGCAGAQPPTEQALEAQEALETRELNASDVDSDDLASTLTAVATEEAEAEGAAPEDAAEEVGAETEASAASAAPTEDAAMEQELEDMFADEPGPSGEAPLVLEEQPADYDPFGEEEGEEEEEEEGEEEEEEETTASEATASEMGELPDDLDLDDDIWEASQEEAKREEVAAPMREEEAPKSLKPKKLPHIAPHAVKRATVHQVLNSSTTTSATATPSGGCGRPRSGSCVSGVARGWRPRRPRSAAPSTRRPSARPGSRRGSRKRLTPRPPTRSRAPSARSCARAPSWRSARSAAGSPSCRRRAHPL